MRYNVILYGLKDWLERQIEKEDVLLDAVTEQYKTLIDGLLPQVRLAAIENDMESEVEVSVKFVFEDNAITLFTEGRVIFPAKVTEIDSITV